MKIFGRHIYKSTACQHNEHDRCRKTCKFCGVECRCWCHVESATRKKRAHE